VMLVDFSLILYLLFCLFGCACDFTYFLFLIKLLNNELIGRGGYRPVVGPPDPV
jgi:hypothetical protein